jgi:CDK inhibitor PHO81
MKLLPTTVGFTLELAYSPLSTVKGHPHRVDLNQFVDAVLRTIYSTSASLGGLYARRKIVFVSFYPDICVALNWKQPNCELRAFTYWP